ncbi:MAG: SpoIIE family protein phosphatase [Acidobacteriota bacterium]|nr:SpoIIE family protein phosphatase [Acidobacteriota bacterium]
MPRGSQQCAAARKFPRLARIFTFVVLLLHPSPLILAQGGEAFVLTPEKLKDGEVVELDELNWRYHTGDDAAWAAQDFDDSGWESITNKKLNAKVMAGAGWNGTAWFRLRVAVDEALATQPLALRLWHWGASEIYLDGKLLQKFGRIEANGDTEFNPRGIPVPFVFGSGGEHTLAVRHSFRATSDPSRGTGRWLVRGGFHPGFNGFIQSAPAAITSFGRQERDSRRDNLLIGILFAFALLHFLIFIFYRRERANLFYSLFAFSLGMGTLLSKGYSYGGRTAFASALLFASFIAAHAAAFLLLLAFLYVAFAGKFSKFFWLMLALLIGVIVVLAIFLRAPVALYVTCAFFLLTIVDAMRIMVQALVRRRGGAWIIMTGVLVFACGVLVAVIGELNLVDFDNSTAYAAGVCIMLAVPLSVSIFLARNFARTNEDLAAQLEQVKTLSARQLEHERTEADLRLQHEKERAENERRAQELEGARQLQLSMLPKQVPQLPGLDIAAYMKPATEVGGDYYDFHLSDDGTLTVAVGDATGHGLRAGTMVTAMKSLFNTHAQERDITHIFKQSSGALKRMNFRSLYMGMTMIKICGSELRVSAAGMPPVLIYRAAAGQVEEVSIKAMPLGSVASFPYKEEKLSLSFDDVIMLMTDGFAERFNAAGEMLDYATANTVLEQVAAQTPQEIIDHFVQTGESWADGHPQDDDVTFVVVKVKHDW